MDYPILRTRLDVLRSSFEQVGTVLDEVRKRRTEVRELAKLLAGDDEADEEDDDGNEGVRSISDAIRQAKRDIDTCTLNAPDEDFDTFKKLLKKSSDAAAHAIELLDKVRDRVEKIRRRSRLLPADALTGTFRLDLIKRAEDWVKLLNEIDEQLLTPAEEQAFRGNRDGAAALFAQAWERFQQEVAGESVRVFREYVDFLGGLALRDTGFDQGMCEIADALIRTYNNKMPDMPEWQSLTIPVHQKAAPVSLARIIRFGFPEWTIWAIPLMAHEFGDVVVNRDAGIMQYAAAQAKASGILRSHIDEYLADAFATFAMGPAYAYAALLLSLEPFAADEPGPLVHRCKLAPDPAVGASSAAAPAGGGAPQAAPAQASAAAAGEAPPALRRAHVILTMLKKMDAASNPRKYIDVHNSLTVAWNDALAQVRVPAALPAVVTLQLDNWVNWMANYLDRSYLMYPSSNWGLILEWADQLLRDGDERVDGIKFSPGNDLRDVLNAAWVCRARNPREQIPAIATSAGKLWERLVKKLVKRKVKSRSAPRW